MNPKLAYWPNLMDYARALLLIGAFFVALWSPLLFITLYGLSYVIDIFDGMVARRLNQTTRFGAALDMVIDRSANACLFAILAVRLPEAAPLFLFLLALDLSSHYLHMLAAAGASHKRTTRAQHGALLHAYYARRLFMGTLAVGHEVAFLGAYVFSFFPAPLGEAVWAALRAPEAWWQMPMAALFVVAVPLAALKTIVSVAQFGHAARMLLDRPEDA